MKLFKLLSLAQPLVNSMLSNHLIPYSYAILLYAFEMISCTHRLCYIRGKDEENKPNKSLLRCGKALYVRSEVSRKR